MPSYDLDRRNFIGNCALSASALAVLAGIQQGSAQPPAGPTASSLELLRKLDPEKIKGAYAAGARDLGTTPYVYAFYDETNKKFISPEDITPELDKSKQYTMNSSLMAFNIQSTDQDKFKNLKNQVQLGFNAAAPISGSDELTWVFLSAIDVFSSSNQNRPNALTTFQQGNGVSLQSTPKVTVSNGILSLQVTAFGQKQDGPWTKFFNIVHGILGSKLTATALQGFGIPSLAKDALGFVDSAIQQIEQQEKLVSLWKTGSLKFSLSKDVPARFKMKKGLMVTVDTEYAQNTNFLDGHTIDTRFQTFRVTDKQGKPADANYLVADLDFA